MAERLDRDALAEKMGALPGWSLDGDGTAITRSFVFADFADAFAFMTRVALAAERADHHPDWSNSWNRVEISLTTHSVGGLTPRDFALAAAIDTAAAQLALADGGD